MKEYLKRNLPLLYILSAIAFLMIYTHGDVISVFNFMLIPFYILMILNGQTGILGLNINPITDVVIDVIILSALIYALYVLFKAGWRRESQTKTKVMSSLLILIGFALSIACRATLVIATVVTLAGFFVVAIITFLTVLTRKD